MAPTGHLLLLKTLWVTNLLSICIKLIMCLSCGVYPDHEIWMMNNLTFGNRLEFQSRDCDPIHKTIWKKKQSCVMTWGLDGLKTSLFSWFIWHTVSLEWLVTQNTFCCCPTVPSIPPLYIYHTACQLLFSVMTFVWTGLITDIFNYTANNLSICMDFPANIRANRVVWRAESVRGEKQGRHVKVRILLMRDGPLNNWMGWAVSTVEAEAFKALAIIKENPPSTLCSVAVIYARASERVPLWFTELNAQSNEWISQAHFRNSSRACKSFLWMKWRLWQCNYSAVHFKYTDNSIKKTLNICSA